MNEERQVEPWPKWVRYPLIALLAVLVLIGIVSFARGHVSGAAIRTVLIVTLVPLLFAPLQRWGLTRRARRLRPRLDLELSGLADQIEQELRREPAQRTSGASDESLWQAASSVARARNLLVASADGDVAACMEGIANTSGGSWARKSPLGLQLAKCVRSTRTLGKVSRGAKRPTS